MVVVVVVLLLHGEYMIVLRLIGLIRLSDHRGALALFAAAQAGASFAQALTVMSHAPRRGSANGAAHGAPSAQKLTFKPRPARPFSERDAAQLASASFGAEQPAWSSDNAAQPT